MSDNSKRAKNFSPFKRNLLTDLVLQRKEVTENKKTDEVMITQKKRPWEDLRTEKQLKELYFIMKRKESTIMKTGSNGFFGALNTRGIGRAPKTAKSTSSDDTESEDDEDDEDEDDNSILLI